LCGPRIDVDEFKDLRHFFILSMAEMWGILPDTVEQAIAIIRWHLEETKRLLAPFPIDTGYVDAEKLMRWLLSKQLLKTTPRALQQLGPLRQRNRRDNALSVLVEHNWIRLGNRNNQAIIEVNPNVSMDY
jgi:hypothetical protein